MREKNLLDYILENNLMMAHKGNEPTFVVSNRQEILDSTLVSDSLDNN